MVTTPNTTGAVTALRALVDTGLDLSFAMIEFDLTKHPEVGDKLAAFRDVLAEARDLPIAPAASPPEDAPAVDGGDAVRLYHAVNRMMAALGAEGEVSTRHRTVQQVMDELARIDGGAYDETLAAAPAPAVEREAAIDREFPSELWSDRDDTTPPAEARTEAAVGREAVAWFVFAEGSDRPLVTFNFKAMQELSGQYARNSLIPVYAAAHKEAP